MEPTDYPVRYHKYWGKVSLVHTDGDSSWVKTGEKSLVVQTSDLTKTEGWSFHSASAWYVDQQNTMSRAYLVANSVHGGYGLYQFLVNHIADGTNSIKVSISDHKHPWVYHYLGTIGIDEGYLNFEPREEV